jgi:hypothetical protein
MVRGRTRHDQANGAAPPAGRLSPAGAMPMGAAGMIRYHTMLQCISAHLTTPIIRCLTHDADALYQRTHRIGGQSQVWPTISGGQRREKVSVDGSSAALTGQLDRSARRVDPKRRKPALL